MSSEGQGAPHSGVHIEIGDQEYVNNQ